MTRRMIRSSLFLTLGVLGGAALAGPTPLTTVRVASGFSQPTYVTHAPGDFERLFVLEQAGRIRIIKNGALLATPFLDIDPIVGSSGNEQGLLGLAFHPDYQNNGLFYVNYTNNGGHTIIRRYSVSADPDIADDTSDIRITRIDQPFPNHNGGWIDFGPDGYLYVALGDGGSACDPGQRAQDITDQLLGKLLRIDVDGDDFPADDGENYAIPPDNPFVGITGDDEIWAYGLRNPWRCSFDRLTGDLWIGDVGQGQREEIDFEAAGSPGGGNYGWDCKEGTACSTVSGCSPSGCACADGSLIDPIHEYTHGGGNCSLSGGYVYRGCAIPDLEGHYFFGDFCTAIIWSLTYDGVSVSVTNRTTELDPPDFAINQITSFGEDAFGEVYIVDRGGEIFKIVPDVAGGIVGTDCNNNGVDDACDLLSGAGTDDNGNGVLDQCECPGDLDGDGDTDLTDVALMLAAFGNCVGQPGYDPAADLDSSGCVDLPDLSTALASFGCDTP